MQIAESDVDMTTLAPLLFADKKTAYRFSWLLSDIGEADAGKLFDVLSYAFEQRNKTEIPGFEQQFAKYWRIGGVPEEDKGMAIDMMFGWLVDTKVGVHIKSVSLEVLYDLTKEYPELKNELKLCLEDQLDKNTDSFKKKAKGILKKL